MPLVLLAGCSAPREVELASTFERAQATSRRGDSAEALRQIDQALPAIDAAPASEPAWKLRLLRGEILIGRRELAEASSLIDVSLPQTPALVSIRGRQRYLDARIGLASNDLARALRSSAEARRIAPDDREIVIDTDLLDGQVRVLQREWQSAEPPLRRSLDGALNAGDRYRQLLAINNIGYIPMAQSRYDEALVWFERALGYSEFEQAIVYATVMSNAGICYSRLGLFDRAVRVQERAVAVQQARGPSKALAEALGSLGNTYVLRGESREALSYLYKAFEAAHKAGLEADAALWAVNLGAAHASLDEWDEAEKFNELSRTLGGEKTGVKQASLVLNAANVAVGRGDLERGRDLYTEALTASEGTAAVEWTAQAGLAHIAIADRQPQVADRHFEAALKTVERTRSGLLTTDYKISFLTQLIEFYQSYVDALVAGGRTDRALEIADSSRGRVLAERQRVDAPARTTVATFQQVARRTRTVLLSYWLAPKRSFLWVVTGAGIRRIDLPPEAEIEAAVRAYREMLDNFMVDPLTRSATPGDRLFQMLVAPAGLPDNASVIIVARRRALQRELRDAPRGWSAPPLLDRRCRSAGRAVPRDAHGARRRRSLATTDCCSSATRRRARRSSRRSATRPPR